LDALGGEVMRHGLLGFRNVCRNTDERTVITCAVPAYGVGNSLPLLLVSGEAVQALQAVVSNLAAFAFDYGARQKLGGSNLNFFIAKQFPLLGPNFYSRICDWDHASTLKEWLISRAIELSYTAWDLAEFAQDFVGLRSPFRWDEDRRFLLRCELDAAFFHLYLQADSKGEWRQSERETAEQLSHLKPVFPTPRDAVEYIMETFPIVKRNDVDRYGEYRTERVILEMYDRMQLAIASGKSYRTCLTPPPADFRCYHSPLRLGILAFGSLISDPGNE